MLRSYVVSLIIFAALILCVGSKRIDGQEKIEPWMYSINSSCNNDHPELGRCLPGIDDSTTSDGKCWKFCIIEGCESGGFCKLIGKKHVCHCYNADH
ncbi:defensin-like protein 21 [Capsella rubella]|uniref:defensin-like protein 21 n=1 Tax=Capsella rubella TaxID=81985 RepID=UPI000CD4D279|nr:defensin-like protein 21 [Capsella rubella]